MSHTISIPNFEELQQFKKNISEDFTFPPCEDTPSSSMNENQQEIPYEEEEEINVFKK